MSKCDGLAASVVANLYVAMTVVPFSDHSVRSCFHSTHDRVRGPEASLQEVCLQGCPEREARGEVGHLDVQTVLQRRRQGGQVSDRSYH